MKKNLLTNKQKKDLKYFTIMTIIIYIVFEILKHYNQFNLISFIAGETCMTMFDIIKAKIYKGSASNE